MEAYSSKDDQSNVGQSNGASDKESTSSGSEEDVRGAAVEKELDDLMLSTASGVVEAKQGKELGKSKVDKPPKQQSSSADTDTSGSEDDETVKPEDNVYLSGFQSLNRLDPYPGGMKTQEQFAEFTDEVNNRRQTQMGNLSALVHLAAQDALANPPI